MGSRAWTAGIVSAAVVAGSAALTPLTATTAAPPPDHKDRGDRSLGNGLGRLVAEEESTGTTFRSTSGVRIDPDALSIRDSQGRVMVQLTPQAGVDRAAYRSQAEARGLHVKAVDQESGTLEGFVAVSSIHALAILKGTGTIAQSVKPITRIGKATSQGVALQRVGAVHARGIDGEGITIGAMSDSYDQASTSPLGGPLKVHARDDVKSGDLPGKGNARYPQPVVVIEDTGPDGGSDEGRAMLQIAHDIAPAAKLCYATAFISEVSFANNIRRLADQQGACGADVIVDDIGYYDEPFFSDGIVSEAVDDVAAKGVHYFSAAGNSGEDQSWDSAVNLVPASQGLRGTNLDFSDVDPALYDGGLQDMNYGSGTDVAQDVRIGEDPAGAVLDLQWNDPFDLDGATFGNPYFSATGEITKSRPAPTFTFNALSSQVGKQVQFRTDAIPSGTTDLVLTVTAPDGTVLGEVDTGTSPEVFVTTLKQAGPYKITVSGFDGATGDFTVDVRPVVSPSRVTTDFNLLLFDADGSFIGAIADQNRLSGRPIELTGLAGPGDIQVVISRAGTGPIGATRLRHLLAGDTRFLEYSDPLAPAIWGHPTAAGATAVAAYDPFRSFLPEAYTSPGGNLQVFFDSDGNRYSTPRIRQVPQVASTDRGNTTFFVADDLRDPDTLPNFGGTSAAAPHAAAIAALVLEQAGGGQALSPRALRTRLKSSTFDHDLDPMVSGGSANGLTVTARGNQGREVPGTSPGSMNDPRFFRVSYSGTTQLRSLTFYGATASPTALGKRNPPASDGIVFDRRPFTGIPPYDDEGFPFTIGATSGGLSRSEVTPTFSVPGGGESKPGQFRRLTLTFEDGLRNGQGLRFGVDRDLAVSGFGGSNEGNGADELGGAIFLPQGTGDSDGMVFVGELTNGQRITGSISNDLGSGFSPVDGYGVINAQEAVFGAR